MLFWWVQFLGNGFPFLFLSLREAGATGRQTGELAAQLDIDHRDISCRIQRMNKRMENEIGESIMQNNGHKWRLVPRLRRDLAAGMG